MKKCLICAIVLLFALSTFTFSSLLTQNPNQKIVNPINSDKKQISPSPSTSNLQTAYPSPSTNNENLVLVTKVVDGDTIEIEGGARIRYIGIDTPETVHPSKPVQCYGKEASSFNKQLVLGKKVRLEKDISNTDIYGRLLRYVWLDELLVNEYLVQEGYAVSSTFPPDVKYQDLFVQAQKLAREQNKGLWGLCEYFGEPAPSTSTQPNLENCLIKGNISYTTGEKIYHLPGCKSYEQTQINETYGERWFCTEEEALSLGWRKAKNCP